LVKILKQDFNLKNKLLIIFIRYKSVNELFVFLNNTFRPYLKTIKKGLTYVGPGDGEPYF